jgi:hypothetical protein
MTLIEFAGLGLTAGRKMKPLRKLVASTKAAAA